MSDTNKTVAYAVDANADGFVNAMQRSRAAAQESAKSIESAFGGLGSVFKGVQGAFAAMLGVFAGGAAFAAAINVTKEWGAESGKLSKQLQITTAEAAAYQVAAKTLGVDVGSIVDASDKMSKQLQKNESSFKALHIETRNANGSWRSTGELLPEVMDKLRGITNTTQQNIAGQQLFGKSWTEVRGLMKLGAEQMEQARQKVKDLNLEVDPAAVKKYNASIADIKLIVTSLSIQVGNALLPVLTELGAWFGQVGPYVVGAFSVSLKVVMSAVNVVWSAIRAVVQGATGLVVAFVELMKGNYSKAYSALNDFGHQMVDSVTKGFDDAVSVWKPKPIKPDVKNGDGGAFIDFEKAKHAKENIVQLWQTQLEERKLKLQEAAQAEGRFADLSKSEERAYWQTKLALTDAGSRDQLAVRQKIAALGLEVMQAEFATQQAELQAQQQAYKNNLDARGVLLQQEAQLVAQKFGEHSKEYAAVQGKIVALTREASSQRVAIEQITQDKLRSIAAAKVDADQARAQLDLELQKISHAEYLQFERQFEDRRFDIRLEALQGKLQLAAADPDRSPVEIARINAEIEQLELQHQNKLLEIRNKATLDSAKYTTGLIDGLRGGFQGVFAQIGTSIKSIGGLLQGLMQVVVGAVRNMLARMAADWAINLIKGKVSAIATALGQIQANSAVAGSGGVASMAAAPFPLNLGAPAFGASMAAASMAFAAGLALPSAAGGWEVPRDTLAMIHEKEVILPASIAQPLKQQLADGSFGSGGGSVNVSIAAHPMPGNYFMVHRDQLIKALQSAVRDNAWKPGR